MYDQAFLSSRFGYASSIGVFIIFLSLLITFALNYFLDERDDTNGGRRLRLRERSRA